MTQYQQKLPWISNLSTCLQFCMLCCVALVLLGCGKNDSTQDKTPPAPLVTTAVATSLNLEIREETVGTLEGLIDPTISAEVAARVLKIEARSGQRVKKGDVLVILDPTDLALQRKEAQAQVARLEALVANQARIVERNEALVQKNFISKNALDDVVTQKSATIQELEAARIRLASIEHTGTKTRVVAPVDGVIEKHIVSTGDFVSIGSPMLQIISKQRLRAHLPFPERVAGRIKPGLKVRLSTPTSETEIMAEVRELKPLISEGSRAIDVLVDVSDQDDWQPGASVNGTVILGERVATVVPEQSVVLRPAGNVVYVIKDSQAEQRVIKTGLRQEGLIEILDGINPGEVVAVDGAAFLTDQVKVSVLSETIITKDSTP